MLPTLTSALVLSADGFAAGLSLGLRGVRLQKSALLSIGLLSALFAALSLALGQGARAFVPPGLARLFGAGILLLLGGVCTLRALFPKRATSSTRHPGAGAVFRDPGEGDLDHSGSIDSKEALLLGLSLSIDMLGAGIGLALGTSGSLALLPVAVGVCQAGLMLIACAIGRRVAVCQLPGRLPNCLSGLLLLALGTARLLL